MICAIGLGLLVASDKISGAKDFTAANRAKGDGLLIAGSTLYGISVSNCWNWFSFFTRY